MVNLIKSKHYVNISKKFKSAIFYDEEDQIILYILSVIYSFISLPLLILRPYTHYFSISVALQLQKVFLSYI